LSLNTVPDKQTSLIPYRNKNRLADEPRREPSSPTKRPLYNTHLQEDKALVCRPHRVLRQTSR
jgi:hypothetical protein